MSARPLPQRTDDRLTEKILVAAGEALKTWEERGISLDDALDDLSASADRELRPPVGATLFSYFRNKAAVDFLIAHAAKKGVGPDIRRWLAVTLTRMFFARNSHPELVLNAAVERVKSVHGVHAAGFVNAVCRRYVRETPASALATASESVRSGLPPVLFDRWSKRFSAKTFAAAREASRTAPETYFRARPAAADADLAAAGLSPRDFPFACPFRFFTAANVAETLRGEGMKQRFFYVQDPSTALAPAMAGRTVAAAERVLDLCAAPGGKTLALKDLFPNAEIVAADRSFRRLERLVENLVAGRVLGVHPVLADAAAPPFAAGRFDIVLLDAPCSNSGVFRRRPDAMWRYSRKKVLELAQLQRRLLDAAATLPRSGGALIYSVCSIEKEETGDITRGFLRDHPDFQLKEEVLLTPTADHDGAYAASLSPISSLPLFA